MKNTARYKKLKGKRVPLCDYEGKCMNKAYKEVYPPGKNKGWNYLCKKHFKQEKKKFKGKLDYCSAEW